MLNWWESLTFIEQFFLIVAVPSTLILLIQTVLLIIGVGGEHDLSSDSDVSGIDMDHDFDVGAFDGTDLDVDIDASDFDGTDYDAHHDGASIADSGLRLFTVRGFIAFFTIFGWAGLASMQSGIMTALSLLIAFVGGSISMILTALIIRAMTKLSISGTVELTNAIGKSAHVYIRIPAERSGRGKVNVLVQERLFEADAVTDETSDLKTGQEVTVVGLSGPTTLIVMSKKKK